MSFFCPIAKTNIESDDESSNVPKPHRQEPYRLKILDSFLPTVDDEIEVSQGDIVLVKYREGDWLFVEKGKHMQGFIPNELKSQAISLNETGEDKQTRTGEKKLFNKHSFMKRPTRRTSAVGSSASAAAAKSRTSRSVSLFSDLWRSRSKSQEQLNTVKPEHIPVDTAVERQILNPHAEGNLPWNPRTGIPLSQRQSHPALAAPPIDTIELKGTNPSVSARATSRPKTVSELITNGQIEGVVSSNNTKRSRNPIAYNHGSLAKGKRSFSFEKLFLGSNERCVDHQDPMQCTSQPLTSAVNFDATTFYSTDRHPTTVKPGVVYVTKIRQLESGGGVKNDRESSIIMKKNIQVNVSPIKSEVCDIVKPEHKLVEGNTDADTPKLSIDEQSTVPRVAAQDVSSRRKGIVDIQEFLNSLDYEAAGALQQKEVTQTKYNTPTEPPQPKIESIQGTDKPKRTVKLSEIKLSEQKPDTPKEAATENHLIQISAQSHDNKHQISQPSDAALAEGTMSVVNDKLPMVQCFKRQPCGFYTVAYSFAEVHENDLSVCRGEIVTALNVDDPDWTWVLNKFGDEGFVPTKYLSGPIDVEAIRQEVELLKAKTRGNGKPGPLIVHNPLADLSDICSDFDKSSNNDGTEFDTTEPVSSLPMVTTG